MKNNAFISWNNLATGRSSYLYEFPGKLATLWYDEIVLQVSDDIHSNIRDAIAEKENWNDDTHEVLRNLHVPISLYIDDPWITKLEDTQLLNPGIEVAKHYFKKRYPEEPFDEQNANHIHNAIRVGGAIASSFETWRKLNEKVRCNFLSSYYEGLLLEAVQEVESDDLYTEIIGYTLPDINEYSWDEIIDLRNHPFFDSFRNKVAHLNDAANSSDIKLSEEIVEEIEQKDMKEMLEMFRPTPKSKVIKGIASNIPLPIPINPVSAYYAIDDVKREIDLKKKYGWIYFLLDGRR
ncbi:hypothetical protein JI666_13935 [Bacillus sp. NTK071]|uniref:hypothetical protein n=1 Tax=Bacillus sp. NTK071 TaxID=2802175 RepID=UPI001A8C503B|nr:hypothetical protein [Bacillus sp. NTK071]MBN8209852.1 hypothetical protein [Bacillus sp. NTK071]